MVDGESGRGRTEVRGRKASVASSESSCLNCDGQLRRCCMQLLRESREVVATRGEEHGRWWMQA